jgi:hypothetical protein
MSYCVLCVCLRILMSSISTLPLVVCRRVHVLLCSVCKQLEVKTNCWTSIYVNIHTEHNKT